MAELTIEQKRAVAISSARLRLQRTANQPADDPNQAILDRQAAQFPATETERIRAAQATQFPTSEESGGTPGAMVQPQADPLYRAAAGPGRVVAGMAMMPYGIGKAALTPPQDEAERVASGTMGGLMAKRMILDPAAAQVEKAGTAKTTMGVLARSAAAAVPMAGPYAADIVERYQSGDRIGAVTEGAAAVLTPMVPRILKKIPKSAEFAAKFDRADAVNTAKSLRPVTLEDKAITMKLAPEMSKRGIRGTGKSIDKQLFGGLDESTQQLSKVEARLSADPRPEMQVHMEPLIDQVDTAINKLKVKGTDKAVNPQAVAALEEVRDLFKSLPKYAKIDQVIDLRRKLDAAVDDAGGFRQSTSAADRVTMKARRGGADIARHALNSLDPALKKANRDFSFYRHAVDVVERRTLGDVGKTGSGLPGRGSILDDVLAGWAGEAIGGSGGAALLEGINLARQTRGFASLKGNVQGKLANALRPPQKVPRALLTAGRPQISAPENSAATGSRATNAPATREMRTGRLLTAGKPLPPGTEPPSGGAKMTVETGKPLVRGGYEQFLDAKKSKRSKIPTKLRRN